MTINQPADTAAAPPVATTGRAGTPRRRIIILASVVLVLIAGVVLAVTALIPSAAPAAHGTVRPFTGTGTGTTDAQPGSPGRRPPTSPVTCPPWERKPATTT